VTADHRDGVPEDRVGKRAHPVLGSPHRLKLTIFSPNMAGGASLTTSDRAPKVTWDESVRIARAADAAGFEALIPVARWRGMGSPANRAGHRAFDTFTWASAIAAVTERIGVFATFHVPVYHPVAAAKQIATVDHVSGGRFGLNIVAGWNSDEFAMFGVEQRPHDDRYAVADEWVRFLQQIFAADEEFDFEGEFFRGRNVLSEPKPVQWPSPVVMNAGGSPSGRGFAAKHADVSFALLPTKDAAAGSVSAVRKLAAEQGRELSVYVAGHVVCAATDAEAQAEHRRQVEEFGDMEAAANAIRLLIPNSQSADFDHESMRAAAVAGFFALPLVGSPETVAGQMLELAEAGVDGIALSWLDYEHGIAQYADTLLPVLREAGLRARA
jgi:alkanesulfonate monooxygenase SsuD/methylene tetrahydromethanopterin reductase-like flavin-dependent oxidoreductase (luciferase family)